jgi:hypothetical protein
MRNRMIRGTGRAALVIGLLMALAGCVVEPAYAPGPYAYGHPYHHWGYDHEYYR